MRWDPAQYGRFAAERGRPFLDLIARVDAEHPRRVVDLGCGPGTMTALLGRHWPGAVIEGIDSSPQMIDAARRVDGIYVTLGDVTNWTASPEVDVVVCNAVLQWVPGHAELLGRWARDLVAGGWLAIQVPGNFEQPAHVALRDLASQWGFGDRLQHDTVGTPESYAQVLLEAGLVADAWETTYVHVLAGDDAVLEWLRGTALRPVLGALSEADGARFCAELAEQLRAAYPATSHGTLFPFRRIFAVGHREH